MYYIQYFRFCLVGGLVVFFFGCYVVFVQVYVNGGVLVFEWEIDILDDELLNQDGYSVGSVGILFFLDGVINISEGGYLEVLFLLINGLDKFYFMEFMVNGGGYFYEFVSWVGFGYVGYMVFMWFFYFVQEGLVGYQWEGFYLVWLQLVVIFYYVYDFSSMFCF